MRNLKISFLSIFMAGTLGACVSQQTKMPEGAVACEEPRPQICTRDYRPTCAFKMDGSSFVASNPCEACANADVQYFVAGECK